MISRLPTGDELAVIEAALICARQQRPYYARALSALTPLVADGLGTVAVDRCWRLYLDVAWLGSLPIEQQGAVLGQHEVEHVLREHGPRAARSGADPRAWIVAADAEINDDADPGSLPPGGVYPAALGMADGLLAEEYLEHAHELPCCGGGSGAGRPLEGERDAEEASGVSEGEAETLRDQVAQDVRDYVRANGRGSVPSGIEIWAEAQVSAARVPWSRRIRALVARRVREYERGRSDWTWARPSRRSAEILRPGQHAPRPRIGLIVDTSGSMCERGGDVVSLVRAACRSGDVRVWQIDAAIHVSRARKPRRYRGGGGTDLREALAEAAKSSDIVVAVTDCDTPWPDTPATPTIVVTWPGCAASPPWCERIEISP